jgi:acyl-CoA synthetase (AMP-forming)/AMP-acid ligase II
MTTYSPEWFLLAHVIPPDQMADRVALIEAETGRTVTYAELADAVIRAAGRLRDHGVPPGSVVGLLAENGIDFVVTFFALIASSATVMPINALLLPGEIAEQLRRGRASCLIFSKSLEPAARQAADVGGIARLLSCSDLRGGGARSKSADIDPADTCLLSFSVGLGGFPKPAKLSHQSVAAAVLNLKRVAPFEPSDRMLGLIQFYDCYGALSTLWLSLSIGMTVVTMASLDRRLLSRLLASGYVSVANVVPSVVRAMCTLPLDLANASILRIVISGGAPLIPKAAVEFRRTWPTTTLVQGYGLTEAGGATHLEGEISADVDPTLIGPPIPDVEAQLRTADGEIAPAGQAGELWIRGPQVFAGYQDDPEATAKTVDGEGWLRTGDLAATDDQGRCRIVGRLKPLIKYHGFQVSPAELEAVLGLHPGVRDVAVVSGIDTSGEEVPKALVVPHGPISSDELMSWVAARVARFKKVRQVEFVDEIPRSPSGEIIRPQLVLPAS